MIKKRINGVWLLVLLLICLVVACSPLRLSKRGKDGAWLLENSEITFAPLVSQGARWGAMVIDGETGAILAARNAEELFTPASNMKVVTTAAALELLGPDHVFLTELECRIETTAAGETIGDLIILGGGDPSFCSEELAESCDSVFHGWCDSLILKGMHRLVGRVLGCDDFLASPPPGPSWAWDDLGFGFASLPSGLCFHDNEVEVILTPAEKIGGLVSMTVEPERGGKELFCTVRTGEPRAKREIRLRKLPGERRTVLSGMLPMDEAPVQLAVAHDNPALLAALALIATMEARGIEVTGTAEATCNGGNGRRDRIASHVSPPLKDLAKVMNLESKNLWAEQLLLNMGLEESGVGTRAAGVDAVEHALGRLGLPQVGIAMFDGSGLSRLNMISPGYMARLLQRIGEREWGKYLHESLPIAGQSGTLEDRMGGTVAEGRIRAKTGSMRGIRTLSGYAETMSGRKIMFSIMINGYPGSGSVMDLAMDRFCGFLTQLHH